MENVGNLYSLSLKEVKTYLLAALFVVGNIALPQLCHLVPQGGLIFLPIYFFTLIAAYKYGLSVGLLTAVLSPLINNLLFGMPPTPALAVILTKSILLALAAALVAKYFGKVSLLSILLAVLIYQVLGSLVEWGICESFLDAIQDFRIGIPGMLIQVFGGYALLKAMTKRTIN